MADKDLSNRFADAIKRIVEPLIPDKKEDTSTLDKGSIDGSRGIGYNSSTGPVGASGTPGVLQAPAEVKSIVKSSADAIAESAQQAALNALGATGSGQGSYDTQALLDQTTTASPPGTTINDLVNGGLSGYSGTLNGASKVLELTGLKDCGSGTAITVRTDGFFIPPIGWDEAETPPSASNWEAGYWYQSTGTYVSGAKKGATKYLSALAIAEAAIGFHNTTFDYDVTAYRNLVNYSGSETASGNYSVDYYIVWNTIPINTGWTTLFINCTKKSCSTDYDAAVCLSEAPTDTAWPSGTTAQLTRDTTGSFISSVYDQSLPHSYTEPSSTLSLCTSSGTPVQLKGLKNGGWALYETASGVATGVIHIYNKDNTLAGYTDSAGLQNLLP